MTYDVLGNERHKAVCELRKMPDAYKGKKPTRRWYMELCDAIGIGYATTFANVRDRLIHLLGGDEPDSQKSPIFEDSGTDDAGEITITDELRKFATDPLLGYASQEQHVERITAIADRIDEKFGHIYHQQGAVLQSAISHLIEECNKLHAECDQLRAKLEEADAAIANWREREGSFEESERERDELQKRLDEMREQREHWASEATKMYRLFFPHEEYGMPNEPSEMVVYKINELQANLDAIREALDGNR